MPHPYSRYRLRLLNDCIRILVVPTMIFSMVLFWTEMHLGLLTVPSYLFMVFAASYGRNLYAQYAQTQDANRMGARLAPQVVGKWPGNFDILLMMLKAERSMYLLAFFLELFEKHQTTTLNLRLLWSDMIITMDEEHIKYVVATGFNHFWRGRSQKERLETFLGDGIFNRDDEQWKQHRALARPFFARDRISDFDIFERHAHPTLSIISSKAHVDEPVDVQDLYSRFTLDAAAEFLFGERLNTLHGALPVPGQAKVGSMGSLTEDEFGSFAQAFETSQSIAVKRARRGYFWPILELFKDEAIPHADIISRYLEPIVQRVVKNKTDMRKAGVYSTEEQSIFLEYLADNTDDPKIIRDQLLNILLAGRDTTSSLLTYVTYFMALHPDVTRKMRTEVLEHCGENAAPTFDNIKNLRYIHAVINETMRIFPPVPMNIRESRANPVLLPEPDHTYRASSSLPIYMPGSTSIMYFSIFTQRNQALWGADAEVFDPDRWLDERLQIFTRNPMMYTPFSAGPRICLGQNYARNEATYFLVRLLQQFDTFALAPDAQPKGSLPPPQWQSSKGRAAYEKIWPATTLTLFVRGGLWVRFSKAKDSAA